MSGNKFDLVISGVGGQGTVMLSNVIGNACAKVGIFARTGELHGLSQRSGTVYIHMRIGGDDISPLIPYGEADCIVAQEAMEALRYIEYIKKDGIVIVNKNIIHPPIEVATLSREKRTDFISYDDIEENLLKATPNIAPIDALTLANRAGNPRTENVVFIGSLSALKAFPLDVEVLKQSVSEIVPKKALDVNMKAFDLGYKSAFDRLCHSVECIEREID
jgi:indolepyruvate ferredoxin oxidoreductase beta subunit